MSFMLKLWEGVFNLFLCAVRVRAYFDAVITHS